MSTLKLHSATNVTFEYYNSSELSEKPLTITDENGNAISFSGKSLSFAVSKTAASSAILSLSTPGNISIGGAGNNVITITGEKTFTENKYYFVLYNVTDDTPIAYGDFKVVGL